MYSLIIVEDEFTTRRALINLIPWNDLGFQVDGEFSDGSEALVYLKNNMPDVILTDIKMTNIGGMEIARFVQENDYSTQIVFLSAHSEFSFAKQAIEYGVVHYLLKPVDLKNLRLIFSKIRDRLDKQNEQMLVQNQKVENYKKLISYEKQQLVTDIFFGALRDPEKQLDRLKMISAAYGQEAKVCLMFTQIIVCNGLEYQRFLRDYGLNELQEQMEYILGCLYDNVEFYSIKWSATSTDDLKLLGVFWPDCANKTNEFKKEKIQTAVHDWMKLNATVTILQTLDSLSELSSMKLKVGNHDSRDSLVQDVEFLELLREQSQLLCSYLYQNKQEQGIELCYSLADNCIRGGMEFAYRQCVFIIIQLIDEIAKNKLVLRSQLYNHCMNLGEHVMFRPEVLREWLKNCVCYLFEVVGSQFENREGKSCEKIIAYLREHYNEDVTLTSLADNVFLNPTYISRLIKKEYGKNYSEILTELRIEHAVRLLSNSDMRVCDIAEEVGYNNLKYFYKIFRRVTGKSPSDYRKGEN